MKTQPVALKIIATSVEQVCVEGTAEEENSTTKQMSCYVLMYKTMVLSGRDIQTFVELLEFCGQL